MSIGWRRQWVCRLLGNILRETGRFDEAVTWLERAIATDRTQIAAYHDLVYAKKLTPVDSDLIGRMRHWLQGTDLTAHECTLLHFAIGKGLDDLGEYAAAIEHFDAGNQLERKGLSFASGADDCDKPRYPGRCRPRLHLLPACPRGSTLSL